MMGADESTELPMAASLTHSHVVLLFEAYDCNVSIR